MAVCWVGDALGFNTRPCPAVLTFIHIDGATEGLYCCCSLRDFSELWQLYCETQLQEHQTVHGTWYFE